jgi:hypothetical protein
MDFGIQNRKKIWAIFADFLFIPYNKPMTTNMVIQNNYFGNR